MILALGITHFTWIKGQHIVVNLLLIKPFWRTKSIFILELPTRVQSYDFFVFMIFIDVHIDII